MAPILITFLIIFVQIYAYRGEYMFCKTFCAAIRGVEAQIVQIEADVNDGLPVFQLVGYLNSEAKEAKERVRSAIKNIGWGFPPKRVTVNISPADFRKEGTAYDLAIAIALLNALGYGNFKELDKIVFAGELSLDGHINEVKGVLPTVLAAKEQGFKYCFVPQGNVREGAIVDGIMTIGVSSLYQTLSILGEGNYESHAAKTEQWNEHYAAGTDKDFSDVAGQPMVKRAAMIAVAGGHNMLMQGPPGAGKTMIAERIPGIMPLLTRKESLEVMKINSIYNTLKACDGYIYERPFRAPHHSVPPTGLIGGGANPRAGEISLAHKGVLFLDELTEFARGTAELLRIPLEKKKIVHTRNNTTIEYPCDFTLIAAMNPCPCGYYPDRLKCTCTPLQIKKYLGKLSYPLLDRIDIITQVHSVEYGNIIGADGRCGESSAQIRARVERVLQIQEKRFAAEKIYRNADMNGKQIKKYCGTDSVTDEYLKEMYDKLSLSARGYHKILKVARTIADFEEKENIEKKHIEEAVMYRCTDRLSFFSGGLKDE